MKWGRKKQIMQQVRMFIVCWECFVQANKQAKQMMKENSRPVQSTVPVRYAPGMPRSCTGGCSVGDFPVIIESLLDLVVTPVMKFVKLLRSRLIPSG